MTTVAPDTLRSFTSDCYQALGMPADAADLVADTLVQSDLWGHPSHGVMRVFWYAKRLQSGATSATAAPELLPGAGAIRVMDGHDGVGQVVAAAAMNQAIEAAKAHGIGAVAVRNSGHFGTAMYFTRMAARQGCIGFLSTNASPAMAPWGAMEKRLGTNPWSWAAPAGKHPPLMLDIASTAVARGKLYAAKARGEPIPSDWAMDTEGRPTTDAAAGIAGTILPMAGHKGYAISTVIDMLSGVLSGSGFGMGVTGPYVPEGKSGAGHLALVIDIAACRPLAEFEADMETLIAEIKSARPVPRSSGIFYPGEIEATNEARISQEGISLPDAVAKELRTESAHLGVTCPF